MKHDLRAVSRVRCRGCDRPLTAPLSVLAEYGPRCAAKRLAQLAGKSQDGPTTAQAAVSLIAAHGAAVEQAEYGRLLDGVNPAAVAGLLAAGIAIAMRNSPDGPDLLRRLGLAAAYQADRRSREATVPRASWTRPSAPGWTGSYATRCAWRTSRGICTRRSR